MKPSGLDTRDMRKGNSRPLALLLPSVTTTVTPEKTGNNPTLDSVSPIKK